MLIGLAAVVFVALRVPPAEAWSVLQQTWGHYVIRTASAGAAVLGIAGGVLGSFAVLRRQSLLGDAVSHAALPGIYVLFMAWSVAGLAGVAIGSWRLPEARSLAVVLVGALITGLLATVLIFVADRMTRLKEDAALGVALATFFGLGVVLRSWLQGHPESFGNRAGLEAFLYGSIATMTAADVAMMALPTLVAVIVVAALWKELKVLAFDPEYLGTLGFPARGLDALLTILIVVSVVVVLQMVGVVLMSAMLIAPAVAARQWTERLGPMVVLACLFGAISGLVGVAASTLRPGLATGPVIAVYATGVAVASLLLAPERGVAWRALESRHLRGVFATDTLLLHLAESTGPVTPTDACSQLGWSPRALSAAMSPALAHELLTSSEKGLALTATGDSHVRDLLVRLEGRG